MSEETTAGVSVSAEKRRRAEPEPRLPALLLYSVSSPGLTVSLPPFYMHILFTRFGLGRILLELSTLQHDHTLVLLSL